MLPTALTLLTLPPYLHLIGDVRFGVLAIVWLLLSYFGFFDMGLGRATSRYIAALHDAPDRERESLFWTVLSVNAFFGVAGGGLLWACGRLLLGLLKMPPEMRWEVTAAMPWLASAVPVVTIVSVLMGALEGRERFLTLNALQVFGGCVFQVFPLAVAYIHGPNLSWLIGSAVIARILGSIPMLFSCKKYVPLHGVVRIERKWIRNLCTFGGWVTVGDVIHLLIALDRFIIGAVKGAQALTYYTVPYNFSTKVLAMPMSFARTLFPRFSADAGERADDLAAESTVALAIVITPVVLLALIFSAPFFKRWLGQHIATQSSTACEILLLGVWANSLAHVPFTLLNAKERPDLVAKFRGLELLPFFAILWLGLRAWGVNGAALAWTLRMVLDAVLLFCAARLSHRVLRAVVPAAALLGVSVALVHAVSSDLVSRFILAAFALVACAIWARVTTPATFQKVLAQGAVLLELVRVPRMGARADSVKVVNE